MLTTRRRFLAVTGAVSLSNPALQAAGALNVGMVPDAGATQVSVEERKAA